MRHTVLTGVSRGLGAALFDELYRAGDRLLALGRTFTDRQRRLADEDPDRVRLRPTDLAAPALLPTEDELAEFYAGASRAALVHNAAVIQPLGALGTLPADDVVQAVTVNVTAPVLLTEAALRAVPDGCGIDVVYVTSHATRRISGGRVLYSATKRAAEMYMEGLAAQHDGDDRVVAVCVDPGIMDTAMQQALRDHARSGGYIPDGERYVRLAEEGELPDPVEVARRIVAEHLPARRPVASPPVAVDR